MQEEKSGKEAAEAARSRLQALLDAANVAQGTLQTRVDNLSSVAQVICLLHGVLPLSLCVPADNCQQSLQF